jgi:AbrB family looped-hinge helix DNA binding protein
MVKKYALARETKWVDDKGRVVIPEALREAAGIGNGSWVVIEAYPALEECKALILKKA